MAAGICVFSSRHRAEYHVMLALLYALRESKQQGQDCQDLLRELGQRLGRFRGTMRDTMTQVQRPDEEAILNAALYAIFNAIEGFRGRTEGEAVSYCKRAVFTRTLSHLRAAKSRDVGAPPAGGSESAEEIPEHRQNPVDVLLRRERQRLLGEALDCLSLQERELLERVEIHGERIVDIAQRSGEAQNTLTQRKIRALRKLAQYSSRLGGLEAQ